MNTKGMRLAIERTGEFLYRVRGEHKCGLPEAINYRYSVRLEVQGQLPADGFIIDNAAIHDWFKRQYPNDGSAHPGVSCEQMACRAVRLIPLLLDGRGLAVLHCTVRISGNFGQSWLEASL